MERCRTYINRILQTRDSEAPQTRFVFDQIQLTEYPGIPIESDDFIRQTIRGM